MNDPIAASGDFDAELRRRWGQTPQAQLVSFAKHAQRTRRIETLIWIAMALLAVIVAYVVILGVSTHSTAVRADRAIQASQSAHATAVAQCNQANASRAIQEKALKQVVASLIPPGVKLSATELAQYQRINASIDEAYIPRDCKHLPTTSAPGD